MALYFLSQVLFDMHQDKEQFVLDPWQRGILIRDVAAIAAWQPIDGVVAHPLEEGRLKRRQQTRKLIRYQARKCTQTCRIVGNIMIAKN